MKTVPAARSRRMLRRIAVAAGLFAVAAYAGYIAGARVNTTASLPIGLYWTVDKHPERGDLVIVRPSPTSLFREAVARGYVRDGGALLKEIAASAGDCVTVSRSGVTVNCVLLENSAPRQRDARGRNLTPCELDNYELAADEVFLFSRHNPDSFDSRYFGVQKRAYITDVVRPVLIYVSSL